MTTKIVHYADSNRIGQFLILYEMLEGGGAHELLKALFSLCIVLDVSPHESGRGQCYICVSDALFQELTDNQEIPFYRIDFAHDAHFENPEHEQRRVNVGTWGFVATRQNIIRVPLLEIGHHNRLPHQVH